MKRFVLERSQDVSGISGTGTVAEGIEFTDGVCVLRWKTAPVASTAIYDTVADLIAVHGHEGATQLVWMDKPDLDGKTVRQADYHDDVVAKIHKGALDAFRDDVPAIWRTDGAEM